jgi:pimeloyl-ACP methyl ester carboxylesterase
MGAFAAQHLAATRPGLVESIVLIGSQGSRAAAKGGDAGFFRHQGRTLPDGQNNPADNDVRLRHFFDEATLKATHQVCVRVLCCAVLCCAVLLCAALCCAVLCCAVLCCALTLNATHQDDWNGVVEDNLRFSRPKATVKKQLRLLGSADVPLDTIKCPVLVMTGELDVRSPAVRCTRCLNGVCVRVLCCAVLYPYPVLPVLPPPPPSDHCPCGQLGARNGSANIGVT